MRENTVGIIGAGTMGSGIARTCASRGITSMIKERNEKCLKEALENIEAGLDNEIERWSLTESEKRAILSRIKGVTSLKEFKDVPIVIEALPESKMELKIDILKKMDEVCDAETILITNSSTLSVTELASNSGRPEKVIGLHFLHPVHKIPLVELIRGLQTSDDTFKQTVAFTKDLKKTPIEVFESPGYVTTRAILPLLNEAMHIVMEGVASARDVDRAMRLGYNFEKGPLEMADCMGLQEVSAWMQHLFEEYGELKYRPCPILRKMVRAGHLGVRSGKGFFTYDEEGRRIHENPSA
jgi:3-hydroxybutyryl-CoA dehydrogenase